MYRYDIGTTVFGYANKDTRDMRHLMEQLDTRKHPKNTTQGFNFWMNLGAY